jgi:hypothetical protein
MSIKNKSSKPGNKVTKDKPKHVVKLKENQANIIHSNFVEVAMIEKEFEDLKERHAKASKIRSESVISVLEGAGFDPSKAANINVNFETKEITFDLTEGSK